MRRPPFYLSAVLSLMKRRLLTGAAVIALTLSVGCLFAWVRSYALEEMMCRAGPEYGLFVSQSRGRVLAYVEVRGAAPLPARPFAHVARPAGVYDQSSFLDRRSKPSIWNRLGLGAEWETTPTGSLCRGVIMPHWLIFAAMLAVGLWCIRGLRRRYPPGTCQSCGYDLRASKDRCPECGTAIPPRAEAEGANA